MKIRAAQLLLLVCLLAAGRDGDSQETPKHDKAGRPKLGLVLEGGGALGLAHIGVITWMEEHRIPVSYVAGTSMGGLVGGIYATGRSPAEVRELINGINWDQVLSGVIPFPDLSFRRKEDAHEVPGQLEFGLRDGLRSGLCVGVRRRARRSNLRRGNDRGGSAAGERVRAKALRGDVRGCGQTAERIGVSGFHRIRNAGHQRARHFLLSRNGDAEPARLAGGEKFGREAAGGGGAEQSIEVTVGVGEDVLRFGPEGGAAVLLGVNCEGDARDARDRARGGVF